MPLSLYNANRYKRIKSAVIFDHSIRFVFLVQISVEDKGGIAGSRVSFKLWACAISLNSEVEQKCLNSRKVQMPYYTCGNCFVVRTR